VDYPKIGAMSHVDEFRGHIADLAIDLPCDDALLSAPESPLAQPIKLFGKTLANRFAIQPMEGWDGTPDGNPTEHTLRRWRRFGESGAKLIFGGEAVAVRHDGRANPNQLCLGDDTVSGIAALRLALIDAHQQACGTTDDLAIGLQLTHSGRFSKPNDKKRMEPKIAFHHPILDRRLGLDESYPVLTDDELAVLAQDFVKAAKLAQIAGFDFVDIKHSHGYLGHELLGAKTRPGKYGGSLENRTRFLREVAEGIRSEAPGLGIAVRLSAFDLVPYHADPEQSAPGRMGPGFYENYCDAMPYRYAFGVNEDQPTDLDLTETLEFLQILQGLGISLVNVTAGSPYYNPHIQRPAYYPPSDGYQPPEDPLIGVARQITVTKYLKQSFPEMTFVGSAYSYLQDYLCHVSQAVVREGWVDFIGLGRMVLSYPELPRDVLSGATQKDKLICRTFSDCTTAPRNGLVSGCYPLDPFYKRSEEMKQLAAIKKAQRTS
jgi:2,4-dienoyl-CoA reductase-like NADH-dependent reductase (Old Yellow Enzyme family)